jgi:FAD/FMN-containing dehydrogenase/Fe-S oxidoreductase
MATPVDTDTRSSSIPSLARDLNEHVRGEVHTDTGSRAIYATDASNYRLEPLAVVLPRDREDIVTAVRICSAHEMPITHRGGGTSLAGQTTNRAVVIDSSKYVDNILEIDPERKIARVEPGVKLDDLRRAAAPYDLTFGPDPSTHEYCTLGGMIGNNSCGVHSQQAGRTEDNVEALEILTYDGVRLRVGETNARAIEDRKAEGGRPGAIYRELDRLRQTYASEIRERYPDIPRRVSGYSLPALLPENGFNVARALVGSEGTCVTVLEATVNLVYRPPYRALVVVGYEDIFTAGDHVAEIELFDPIGLEGVDDILLDNIRKAGLDPGGLDILPEGGLLFVEFGGETSEAASARGKQLVDWVERKSPAATDVVLLTNPAEQAKMWGLRESALGATAHLDDQPDTWPGWEDSGVPPAVIGNYMRELRGLYDKYGYNAALYGHFGQGCVHSRIPFDLETTHGVEQYRAFIEEATELCIKYGGSYSAEHGDARARSEFLPKLYGEKIMAAHREFKAIWDPDLRMNPGNIVDPQPIDANLRLGADYDPPEPDTYFEYPYDEGSFSEAALRCVGVGKCRRTELTSDKDVMCPSFLATRDEKHTTRGRARMLWEMLNGDTTANTWNNTDVHEALDLCLACKGCKSDCPVQVDMATYKAEFLAHYHEHNARPRSAYTMGLIYWWARLASTMPKTVNFLTQLPGISDVMKRIGGVALKREIPRFADQTLRDWLQSRARSERETAGANVAMVWPDTFTNYLRPEAGKAAVRILENEGYQVTMPEQTLCCGRPLYDYGMLDVARAHWQENLNALRPQINAGTPLIGLEPGCTASFRDELGEMYPDRPDARRLGRQTFTLAEFLEQEANNYQPPQRSGRALLHGHCHHKSIMGLTPDENLLRQTGLDIEIIRSSCCGMAGSFGFEADHYEVSMQIGERDLLPAVRNAAKDTAIIANGFSCREQIAQATGRHAVHLAEILDPGRSS